MEYCGYCGRGVTDMFAYADGQYFHRIECFDLYKTRREREEADQIRQLRLHLDEENFGDA